MTENHPYTVTKKTDADLAGVAGRLVMQFIDGSCIEVNPEEVVAFKYYQPSKDQIEKD